MRVGIIMNGPDKGKKVETECPYEHGCGVLRGLRDCSKCGNRDWQWTRIVEDEPTKKVKPKK